MKKLLPIFIITVVVVAGASFYAGMRYDQSKNASARASRGQQFGSTAGRGGARGAGANGGFVTGEILSKDATSVTVKLRDGGSKIVFVSETTKVMKSTEGLLSDLVVGEQVTVMGSANADGSVNAESVQIRPAMPVASAPLTKGEATDVKAFTVTAKNFSFDTPTMTVKNGDLVSITLKNAEGFHDFRLDEFNVATNKIGEGQEETITFVANKTGSFEYYCSVGQHRAMGMKGTLVVE